MRLISLRYLVCLSLIFLLPAGVANGALKEQIKGKDGALMALISAGTFDMGTDDERLMEISPLHRVYISDFYMDIHPVTNGQFAEFLNQTKPSEGPDGERYKIVVLRSDLETKERKTWWPTEITYEYGKYVAYKGFTSHPVITVSWNAADAYCKWAGKRLPTEAEWEKAARGGLVGKQFAWGNEIPTEEIVHNRSWDNNKSAAPLEPARSGKPNGYGLYNMAGGVWEWCFDWFAPDYYERSKRKDPRGPESGTYKVLRGGSWFNPPPGLKVALRNTLKNTALDETTGFRCAKNVSGK